MALPPEAYEPPPEEGENAGLIEALAARLWFFRASSTGINAAYIRRHAPAFCEQSHAVQTAWRETARDALKLLLGDMGMVGPAGPPKLPNGWSYAWTSTMVGEWEIVDDKGGYVAGVRNSEDVQMFCAAPIMAERIEALLAAIAGTPAADLPEIVALRESLPSTRP